MRKTTWKQATRICLCALLIASGTAWAQTVRGGIGGTVTDSSGAVVSGATIQAKNEKTGDISTVISTSAGAYRFPELPLGIYDIAVSAAGFRNAILTGVPVRIQQITALDVTLQPGTTTETVTVNANALTVESQTSDIGGIISNQQIVELPLALGGVGALRSPEAFVFLLPGTTGPGTANSNNGIFLSKIAGGQNYGNEVLIDGASQQRSENGSSFDEEAPSVEALQEFKITTALPQAEYGRTTGGIENFVTKSGTNSFHGTAYEIFRNEDLNANTWFNNGNQAFFCSGADNTPDCRKQYARPEDKKNDYGVTLGGPVWIPKVFNGRDKLFFFFSWEQLGYTVGATNISTVPTVAMRNGDFSGPLIYRTDLAPVGTNPCQGNAPVYQGEIFDPQTAQTVSTPNGTVTCRSQFPGNKIDPSRFSPVALNLLGYYPLPTNDLQFNNFTFPSAVPINNTTYTVRIDAYLSQKSRIWGSYNTRENNRISGGNPLLPDPVDPNTWKQDFTTHFGRFGWDYSFTPNLLNHFNFGSNRTNSVNYAQAIFAGVNWSQKLGIGNADSKNFPQITNGNVVNLGNPPQNDDNIDNGLRLNESVAWQKGRHSLAFGFDLRWQQYSPLNGNSPVVNFCTDQTVSAAGIADGFGFASQMLGLACGGSQSIIPHQSRWTSWYYGLFAQDDFKVARDLTLNLGVRWDVDMPRHEAINYTSNFSPTANDPEFNVPGALVFGTTCNGCNTAWADTWYKDIAPRIGFAYSPSQFGNNTVFRGGAGIMYGPLQYSDFGGSMTSGYRANPSFPDNGFDPSFTLDSGFPAFPQPPNLDPGIFNGQPVSGSYIEKQYGRPAMVSEWTLQLQQQVAKDLIMTIGYVGNKAQNLRSNIQNINNIDQKYFALGNHLNDQVVGNTVGVTEPFPGFNALWHGAQVQRALRPFPQYDFIDSGCCLQNVGMSSYQAMLVSLESHFQNGLSFLASYTWAKQITNSDSLLPNNGVSVVQVQNVNNLRDEKSVSAQDVPHTVVLSWLYGLPFGRGKTWLNNGFLSYVAGGWQVGAVQRYMSGQPFSFCCASGIPGFQNAIRMDRVSGSDLKSPAYHRGHINPIGATQANPETNTLFNLDTIRQPNGGAFFDQNAVANRGQFGAFNLGNIPRVTGEVRTPAYYNEDFSILKNTPIHESVVFQLKFELLNAFNRHTFAIPYTPGQPYVSPTDTLFGVPNSTVTNPRNVQITGRINF
ncbi:MAG TPA: carboxypeptidase regulatory-like domain-containing protein [Pseudacidobacterium sp.]|nr:carboxypeptidase regulatory-like domain-containing protein [Pseudacidobacterium sp.]